MYYSFHNMLDYRLLDTGKKHICEQKITQYFSSKGFSADREWTLAECKTALGYSLKHNSVKECIFVIKHYWECKLKSMDEKLKEAEGKVLELTSECRRHKTATKHAQSTCKQLQQTLTEVEQQHAKLKSKSGPQCSLTVAPTPGQPCYKEDGNPQVAVRLYPELSESDLSDGSESVSSDKDSDHATGKTHFPICVKMRPVTVVSSEVLNRRNAGGETRLEIGHIPLDAATLDTISKEFKPPREMGLDFIDLMHKKRNLYSLHPNDGVAIAGQVLNITDGRELAKKVSNALGDKGQNLDKGWEAFDDWIKCKCRKTTDWGQITNCRHRKGESAADFCERFEKVFLRHSGISHYNADNINNTTDGPHFRQLVESLQTDLRQALVTAVPNWRNTKWVDLKNELDRLDVDLEPNHVPASIHILTENGSNLGPTQTFTNQKKECHYCHRIGHFSRVCRKKQADRCKMGASSRDSTMGNSFGGFSQGSPSGISQEQIPLIIKTLQGVTGQRPQP
uniref:CCHC-type domain-containing protein n=1 Tax=Astyanax mexicanus TaxID=7994 RepID=A0A3B1J1L4_ASTMX